MTFLARIRRRLQKTSPYLSLVLLVIPFTYVERLFRLMKPKLMMDWFAKLWAGFVALRLKFLGGWSGKRKVIEEPSRAQTAADLGANIGGAAGKEGERCKVGQPDKPLSCGLDRTRCTGAKSTRIRREPEACNPGDSNCRGGYPVRHCERSQRSRCPTNSGQRMAPVIRQKSTGSY
jgi:hypothetical protein